MKAKPASKPEKAEKPEKAHAPEKAPKSPKAAEPQEDLDILGPHERAIIDQLSQRTRLTPREVVARALSAYAAAVVPSMTLAMGPKRPDQAVRLFVAGDGRPGSEIGMGEFTLGSAEGADLRLDLPLIAPRHARILWKEERPVFEDLKSPRGSYRHGQPLDVRMLEDGDEIDLGGFLPLRFRLA
ncbi:MAG: FHA domain-containing protein [Deltaproteobacteria bacterium]|nr:FHA domain-containing protein [Deltaproteobacteria bacterium]